MVLHALLKRTFLRFYFQWTFWKDYSRCTNCSTLFDLKQSFTENVDKFFQDRSKNLLDCHYYNISELNIIIVNHKKKFSFFHLNTSSLPYHFQDSDDLLKSLKNNFSIIGITENRLKVISEPLINIDLKNYNTESTPTESEKGGTLIYISSDLNGNVRNDLKIYKVKELELISLTKIKGIVFSKMTRVIYPKHR